MHLTDLFIRRPVLSIVTNVVILLVGLKAAFNLPVRQYPELTNTVIRVSTYYPGASAENMQGFITTPLQQKIAAAEGVEYITSSSTQSSSEIIAKIELGFSPEKALIEVMAKVAEVRSDLPADAMEPLIVKETGQSTATLYLALSSDTISTPQITDFVRRQLQPKLATVDGVASTEVLGGQSFAMRVWLDPLRMAAHGVTAADVANALRSNNYQTAAGSTKGAFVVSNISADTDLNHAHQFENIVISSHGDALIRLKDVAQVELAAESANSEVIFDGKPAVFIALKNTPESNPLTMVGNVKQVLPQIEKTLPAGLKLAVVYDSSRFIAASIKEVVTTLAEATLIVALVILLFLGNIRAVVIPLITIPLSLIGICTLLMVLGFSINLLTLLAMVLAIGLVVDDAIVVVENVDRHIAEGQSPTQAAILGAREIASPLITMTLTLVAVYMPIAFMKGLTGALFKEFALTLAGSVLVSGIIALTLSPFMCAKILRGGGHKNRFEMRVENVFHGLSKSYHTSLHQVLAHKKWVLALTSVVMCFSLFFIKMIPKELAPFEDQGFIFISTESPKYTNVNYISTYAKEVSRVISQQAEKEFAFTISYPGSGMGFMILKPWDQRAASADTITSRIQMQLFQIAGINAFAFQFPPLPTGTDGMPFQFVISGVESYENLFKYAESLKQMAQKSGIFMIAMNNLNFNTPQLKLNIDHDKANFLGIKMSDLGSSLALFVGGNRINQFNLQGRNYEVIPQVPRSFRMDESLLDTFYVHASSKDLVPLSTLIKTSHTVGPDQLYQFNQTNAVVMSAVLIPGVAMGGAIDYMNREAAKILPAHCSCDYLSESRQYIQEGNALVATFLFALVIIYLVLASQFESFRDPLIILLSVPLSLFGALLFLFLGFASLNIYTQIGLITLVGLITKHGVLIVEFANQLQRNSHLTKLDAAIKSATTRLRPILMTTMAMVTGLLPLLVAHGAGAASRFSLGIVITTGMIIGTVFTLFVIPTFYVIFGRNLTPPRID